MPAKTTVNRPSRISLAIALATLASVACGQNPTPATNGAAPNQRPANAPQTQLPASHWQNFKNRVGQGGSSVKNFFSGHFGSHKQTAPQEQAHGQAQTHAPEHSVVQSGSHATQTPAIPAARPRTRLSSVDPREVPGSGTRSQDTAPLFPGHAAPQAAARGIQPPAGSILRRGPDGSNMYIHRRADGLPQVLVDRPDGSRVFATPNGASYVQRPWNYQAQAFDRRTYLNGGQPSQQFYRPYSYNGTTLDAYAPQRYFDPGVYQWALRSRTAPVRASWNYVRTPTPWYSHYKGYFAPETSYTNALAWLTDYLIANSLISAWNAHLKATQASANAPVAAAAARSSSTGTTAATASAAAASAAEGSAAEPEVTPEVKQKVAEEISRQVSEESAESQANAQNNEIPPEKSGVVAELNEPEPHTFVVSSDLNLTDNDGRHCPLSEGDVLEVVAAPNPKDNTAAATVLSSKHGECGRAANVAVDLSDLQEMQNHMRETIDQGLANRAGKSGVQATPTGFAAAAPPPEPNVAQEVEQQQKIAAAEG